MMSMVDVVVMGGGPAGTTAAAFLARQGRSVLLLEKDQHPRFHVGEYLLPSNLPLFERLGVLAEVDAIGVHKPGADFTLTGASTQSFEFSRALGEVPDHAWHVRRSEFDDLLFRNCRRFGVDARDRHRVIDVEPTGTGHRVHFENAHGARATVECRFLIDATGRDGFLARRLGWRKKNPAHASAAIVGHFANVVRREGAREGNISIYWFEHGWVWMIPLQGGVMSVGTVCQPGYLKQRDTDLQTFLLRTIQRIPEAWTRMENAVALTPINATGNYSYRSSRLAGDGFLLIGDAYAFIDPVFSSGVYLAMHSAEAAVPLVNAWLEGDHAGYRTMCPGYHRLVDRKIHGFSWFIYRFTTPVMRELFRNPRNDWQVEQAVISMLAGYGDGSSSIRSRLRIFKAIYYLSRLTRIPESIRAWWTRWRSNRVDFTDETILS